MGTGNDQRKVAIYCRISRDMRGEARGVERQLEDCREVARRKGWSISPDALYIDNDVSASVFSTKARREYLRLLSDIEAGKIGAVVMWLEDRTHRQVLELAEFIRLAREHNVKAATPAAEYDLSDPDQVTMWFIKVRFAEAEVEKTSKRLRRERLQTAQRGEPHRGGSRKFGWTGFGKNQVTEEQAAQERELIREAAARLLAGDSVRSIALDWNIHGIPTSRGGMWQTATIRQLLLSPRLAGYRTHHGTLYPGGWEPILPPEQWEAVRALLTDPARVQTLRGGARRYWLSGILRCGICKRPLYGQRGRYNPSNGKRQPPSYRCVIQGETGSCGKVRRAVEPVERLIEGALFEAVESPAWDEVAAKRPADDPARRHHERLAELTAELDTLDGMLAEAELAERQGRKPKPSAATLRRKLAEREAEAEEHQVAAAKLQTGRVVAAIPRNLRAVWEDLSLDRRRSIIQSLLGPKGILVYPQGPGRKFDPDLIVPDWRF
jgi:site-specific DNA recombinase